LWFFNKYSALNKYLLIAYLFQSYFVTDKFNKKNECNIHIKKLIFSLVQQWETKSRDLTIIWKLVNVFSCITYKYPNYLHKIE